MDSQPIAPGQNSAPKSAAQTFQVRFSAPSARLTAQPQPQWKLAGAGEVEVDQDRVVLRGRRPRAFRSGAETEFTLSRREILNVVREGLVIQCHVRDASTTRVLRLWLANDQDAEQLEQALPTERTPDFEQMLAEHRTFQGTLASLGTRPVMTNTLLILNCVIFACTVYAGAGLFNADGQLLINWGTNFGPRTLNGEWWRLFTAMFLHFGLVHLALNMWVLWSLGQLTEKLFGSAYFLVLYVFAGLCGSLFSLYWHPYVNSAGASGAIFGVMGGMFAFMVKPATRIPASIAAAQRNSALIFIAYNLFNGLRAGIDNAAHIGGLLGGFAMGWALARPVDVEARQDPLPRLAVAAAVGATLLVALAWPLFYSVSNNH